MPAISPKMNTKVYDGYGGDEKFKNDTDSSKFRPGVDIPKVKIHRRPMGKYNPGTILTRDIISKMPEGHRVVINKEIIRHVK